MSRYKQPQIIKNYSGSTTEDCLRYQRYLGHRIPKLVQNAEKYLIKLNGSKTSAEKFLSDLLFSMQIKYKEQYLIIKPNKRFYIADFYLEDFHTLIELDGKHHYTEEGVIKDVIRDNSLQELGFKKILRFENKDIFKLTEETITQCLKN